MDKKGQVNAITEGVIWKQLLIFAFPILMSNLFQQLYTTLDSVVVGRYVGSEALAAVGSTGSLCNLLIGFFIGLSTGAGIIIAQCYGANDQKNLQDAVHTAMGLSVAAGLILTVVGVTLTPSLLRLMGTPDDVFEPAVIYLRIYFAGILSLTVYNMGAGILRAIGDSRRPLYYLVISAVINVTLNLVFVCVFHMGVAGVAWATLIAQTVTAILVVLNLTHTANSYRLTIKKIRIHRYMFLRIVRIGIPAGFQSMVVSLSNTVIQAQINSFGSAVVAGISAAGRIDGFLYMPINAFGLAITTFVGQNIGAGRPDRVKKGVRVCLVMALAVTVFIGSVIFCFSRPLITFINSEEDVVYYGCMMVRLMAVAYWLFSFSEIFSGVIRGAGEAVVPMAIYIGGMCVFRILYVLLVRHFYPHIEAVIFCYPISWILTSSTFFIYYFKGNWLKRHMRKA